MTEITRAHLAGLVLVRQVLSPALAHLPAWEFMNALDEIISCAKTAQEAEQQVCLVGIRGSAFDLPETKRAYTYVEQPGNTTAYSLGLCVRSAAAASAGDEIDRGLALLKALSEKGFGVFDLGAEYTHPAPEAVTPAERVVLPEGWLIEMGFDFLEKPFRFVDSKSHAPTIKIVLPACEPEDSSAWELRDEVAKQIGTMLAALATEPLAGQVSVPVELQEMQWLEHWLCFAVEPIGQECCNRPGQECCGSPEPVYPDIEHIGRAMNERRDELLALLSRQQQRGGK